MRQEQLGAASGEQLVRLSVLDVSDVAERQLCCGCGACAAAFPDEIEMVDAIDLGRRPRARGGATSQAALRESLSVCPGIELHHDDERFDSQINRPLRAAWGPVLAMWEGAAADDEIRWAGSSGGAASALALYCMTHAGMDGTIHTGSREDVPYLNETVISRTREELLARTGSRYAPASPLDRMGTAELQDGCHVFIGKPCDVAGLTKLRAVRPEIDAAIGVTIAFFCAGVPSTRATLELMQRAGVDDAASVRSVRYRGNGWPGLWTVEFETDNETRQVSYTYDESWGFLERFRQWRCYICPDHTGEFADIAVGDPWYRTIEDGEAGSSLILARTAKGRAIVQDAIAAGYLEAKPVEADLLPQSQPNLLRTRAGLWGRLVGLAIARAPRPRYRGFPMFRFWLGELGLGEKLRSILGTVKRVRTKRLRKRVAVQPSSVESGRIPARAIEDNHAEVA